MSRPGPEDAGPSNWSDLQDLPPVPRVSQVDAEDLDESLVGMLSERLDKSLGIMTSDLSVDLKPEIGLILRLIIFRYGIWQSLASPGSKLVNIHLDTPHSRRPSRQKLLLYLLLYPPIFPSYLLNRLRDYALSNQWPDLPRKDVRRRIWQGITRLEVSVKTWELVGWLWFLIDPRYPSLLMRILRLQYTATSSHLARLVSYEFMNRQLVWSVFTEFLMYSITLIPPLPRFLSPQILFSRIRHFFAQPTAIKYESIPAKSTGNDTTSTLAHTGILAHLPATTCPICHGRRNAEPVPLSDTLAGSDITLPPLPLSSDPRLSQNVLSVAAGGDHGNEDTNIYVPAQSDCWGKCRWCYYCIQGELVKHRLELENARGLGVSPRTSEAAKQREEDKWACLRCGGSVTRAWRVSSLQPNALTSQNKVDAVEEGERTVAIDPD